MIQVYEDAEIYLTECIHPDFNHLRYIGLDTKCDPNYLGSSVTLKWWINYLGRRYFRKTILERVSGTMKECCKVEQRYILEHNAVKSPNYFNMNGEKQRASIEDTPVSMDYTVRPSTIVASDYIDLCLRDLQYSIKMFSSAKRKLAHNILCTILYGYLKYDQEEFEYCKYTHYGACKPEDTQEVLSALAGREFLDFDSIAITIQDKLVDDLPASVTSEHFKVLSIN